MPPTRMKEGLQEEDMLAQVYCPAFKKFLIIQDCNKETCEFHGSIQKEPIIEIDEAGNRKQVGMKASVVCHFPELRPIQTLCRIPLENKEIAEDKKEDGDKGKE